MTEENQELAAIQHLLEIEKQAASLVDDAKIQAQQYLTQAHAEYNAAYKEKLEVVNSTLEADFKNQHEKIQKKYDDEIENYKADFSSRPQNKKAFEALLEKLLFA